VYPSMHPSMSPSTAAPPRPRAPWWLRLASSGPSRPLLTQADRELARRSDLIAWLTLGVLVALPLLALIALDDREALLALLGLGLGLGLTSVLNRLGLVTLAGSVLIGVVAGAIWGYMLASPLGLTMGQLPDYDLLAVTVVIAASVLPRATAFLIVALNSALIVTDYLLRPHNANLIADAALYASVTQQTVSLLVRPIALNLVLAVVAYLWVRGTERAIRRADRAEEFVVLETREVERTQALEEGVRYVRQTIAQWAHGDLTARVPVMPLPALRNMRDELNGFIIAFSYLSNADSHLRRLQGEVSKLTVALDQWAQGRAAVWPTSSGTALDRVLEILAQMRRRASRPSAPPPPSASPQRSPQRAAGEPAPGRPVKGVQTMARYCGACGARFDEAALAGGRCLVCGQPITDPRDAIAEALTQPVDGSLGQDQGDQPAPFDHTRHEP
jgi:hypothetical protein